MCRFSPYERTRTSHIDTYARPTDAVITGKLSKTEADGMDSANAVLKSVDGYTNRAGDSAAFDVARFIGRNGPAVVRTPDLVLPANNAKVKMTFNLQELLGTLRYRRPIITKAI